VGGHPGDSAKVQIVPGDIGSQSGRLNPAACLVFESMDLEPQKRVYLTLFVFFALSPDLAVGLAGAAGFFASNARPI
jgi:hypothetical protein